MTRYDHIIGRNLFSFFVTAKVTHPCPYYKTAPWLPEESEMQKRDACELDLVADRKIVTLKVVRDRPYGGKISTYDPLNEEDMA